jgi:succinoglycan biosynthesis protein ExoV
MAIPAADAVSQGRQMELHYFRGNNFGDSLNGWFWDRFCPGWREARDGSLLVGVGTLIHNRLPAGRPKLIMGSGAGYGPAPSGALLEECEFRCVRGPRSAAVLGLPPEAGVVDPAVLVADLPEFANIPVSGRPIFVPHHDTHFFAPLERIAEKAGVDLVRPNQDARDVIRRIAAAPLVLAESMHAAIIADAFGRPWHNLVISPVISEWKWLDWAESLAIPLRFNRLAPKAYGRPGVTITQEPGAVEARASVDRRLPARAFRRLLRPLLERAAVDGLLRLSNEPGQLSDRSRLAEKKERLLERLTLD